MAMQSIGLGAAPNDGTGSDLRTAGDLINDNFLELYASRDAIQTASGIADLAVSLGTFTGVTIADTLTVKAAIQSLETAYESTAFPASLTVTGVLTPGAYVLDTSAAAFAVTLTASVKGAWKFIDYAGSTLLNALTIGTASETYNGIVGPLVFDSGLQQLTIYNHDATTAYYYTEM